MSRARSLMITPSMWRVGSICVLGFVPTLTRSLELNELLLDFETSAAVRGEIVAVWIGFCPDFTDT